MNGQSSIKKVIGIVSGKGGVGKTTVCGMMIDALIKGGKADEQENAKKFIDFMCSAEGQNLYAENNSFRVPTNSQATPAEGLVTLDSVAVIDYDAKLFASPELSIPAGCRIFVRQDGVLREFVSCGEAMVYPTHQEIPVSREESCLLYTSDAADD